MNGVAKTMRWRISTKRKSCTQFYPYKGSKGLFVL